MKYKTILPFAALAASSILANADQHAPIGELNIDTVFVRTGAKPLLSWKISYPSSSVEEVVTIEKDDSIVTKEKVRLDVRLLGATSKVPRSGGPPN